MCLPRHAPTLWSLRVSSQTRMNCVIFIDVFLDMHDLCHHYLCLPRHTWRETRQGVSSQTGMCQYLRLSRYAWTLHHYLCLPDTHEFCHHYNYVSPQTHEIYQNYLSSQTHIISVRITCVLRDTHELYRNYPCFQFKELKRENPALCWYAHMNSRHCSDCRNGCVVYGSQPFGAISRPWTIRNVSLRGKAVLPAPLALSGTDLIRCEIQMALNISALVSHLAWL